MLEAENETKAPPSVRETLEDVFEEWVLVMDRRQIVAYKNHQSLAVQKGWWVSGWRGVSEEMKPLPAEVSEFFDRER